VRHLHAVKSFAKIFARQKAACAGNQGNADEPRINLRETETPIPGGRPNSAGLFKFQRTISKDAIRGRLCGALENIECLTAIRIIPRVAGSVKNERHDPSEFSTNTKPFGRPYHAFLREAFAKPKIQRIPVASIVR